MVFDTSLVVVSAGSINAFWTTVSAVFILNNPRLKSWPDQNRKEEKRLGNLIDGLLGVIAEEFAGGEYGQAPLERNHNFVLCPRMNMM